MPASGAVNRSTLRQQIADALRDEVLAGRMRPRVEFTVRQIAEQYGVSATPVREALFDLSAQGLLESDQHRGFRVREFSVADYRSMVKARALVIDAAFRGVFDGSGAERRLLATHQAALVSVRRRAEEAVRAARGGDLDILIGYDLRFWRELGAVIGNPYITEFLHRMRVQAWVFAVPYLRGDADVCDWLWNGHQDLVEAIIAADGDAVRAVLDASYAHGLSWADRLAAGDPRTPDTATDLTGPPRPAVRRAAGPMSDRALCAGAGPHYAVLTIARTRWRARLRGL